MLRAGASRPEKPSPVGMGRPSRAAVDGMRTVRVAQPVR
jgi:hypothetical protein